MSLIPITNATAWLRYASGARKGVSQKETLMFAIIIFILLLFVIDIVALRRGYDSRDGIESKEWGRRSQRGWSV